MKRPRVFLLVGPPSVVIVWLIYFFTTGGNASTAGIAAFIGVLLFCFTLVFATFAFLLDDALARHLPLFLRAPLTALAGAAGGLFLGAAGLMVLGLFTPAGLTAMNWLSVLESSMPWVIVGALIMGMCSLLSHDYGRNRAAVKD
jgi:hypothetical protein